MRASSVSLCAERGVRFFSKLLFRLKMSSWGRSKDLDRLFENIAGSYRMDWKSCKIFNLGHDIVHVMVGSWQLVSSEVGGSEAQDHCYRSRGISIKPRWGCVVPTFSHRMLTVPCCGRFLHPLPTGTILTSRAPEPIADFNRLSWLPPLTFANCILRV